MIRECEFCYDSLLDGQDLKPTSHTGCWNECKRRERNMKCVYCGKTQAEDSREARCDTCISTNNITCSGYKGPG